MTGERKHLWCPFQTVQILEDLLKSQKNANFTLKLTRKKLVVFSHNKFKGRDF